MIPSSACAAAAEYDDRLRLLCPEATVRPEVASDRDFLHALFIACSPLRDVLPAPMVEEQARIQYDSLALAAPQATRRIVEFGGVPVARIALDWSRPGTTHGVDIARLPAFRATGIGPLMLHAWIETIDRFGLAGTLRVAADNPARLLYRQLGFRETPDGDPAGPVLMMARAARAPR